MSAGPIVAIGGGSMAEGVTLAIDRHIVGLAGGRGPRALVIPTASYDAPDRRAVFHRVYGRRLGCRTDELLLLGRAPSARRMARAIGRADLVYVLGGNTLKMMRRWRRLGVDRLLRRAHRDGTVLSGLSAGMLCWFEWGHSDSIFYYHPECWDYIRVRGLGLISATGCPHYDGERRDRSFRAMIRRRGGVGLALDDGAALEVRDGRARVIASKPGAAGYRVTRGGGGKVVTERIGPDAPPASVRALFPCGQIGVQ
jgi:dipeptidase E